MKNRTLKFRAFDSDRKVFTHSDHCEGEGIYNWKLSTFFEWAGDGDVIQQFTGLLDKNGKEIYEGDVVKSEENLDKDCIYGDETTYVKYSVVEFSKGCFTCNEDDFYFLSMNPSWFEIVGNIFENSNLLTS